MAGNLTYSGRIVGVNSRDYSFPDRATGEIIAGTTHTIYLRTDDESEPILELRGNDEIAVAARSHDGKVVTVTAEPRSIANKVTWYALAFQNGN